MKSALFVRIHRKQQLADGAGVFIVWLLSRILYHTQPTYSVEPPSPTPTPAKRHSNGVSLVGQWRLAFRYIVRMCLVAIIYHKPWFCARGKAMVQIGLLVSDLFKYNDLLVVCCMQTLCRMLMFSWLAEQDLVNLKTDFNKIYADMSPFNGETASHTMSKQS